jgi:hypothetical protein
MTFISRGENLTGLNRRPDPYVFIRYFVIIESYKLKRTNKEVICYDFWITTSLVS